MQTIANLPGLVRTWAIKLGPYVLLEMLLPGGTLLAFALFLYRRGQLLRTASEATGVTP